MRGIGKRRLVLAALVAGAMSIASSPGGAAPAEEQADLVLEGSSPGWVDVQVDVPVDTGWRGGGCSLEGLQIDAPDEAFVAVVLERWDDGGIESFRAYRYPRSFAYGENDTFRDCLHPPRWDGILEPGSYRVHLLTTDGTHARAVIPGLGGTSAESAPELSGEGAMFVVEEHEGGEIGPAAQRLHVYKGFSTPNGGWTTAAILAEGGAVGPGALRFDLCLYGGGLIGPLAASPVCLPSARLTNGGDASGIPGAVWLFPEGDGWIRPSFEATGFGHDPHWFLGSQFTGAPGLQLRGLIAVGNLLPPPKPKVA